MTTLELSLDEETVRALEEQAGARYMTPQELAARWLRRIVSQRSIDHDPLMQMSGVDDFESADIDETVYE